MRKATVTLASFLIALALAIPAQAGHVFVDDVADGAAGTGISNDPFRDLQAAIIAAPDGATVIVLPGRYEAQPKGFVELIAGNALEPATPVPFRAGFVVEGKPLEIIGASPGETVLVTNAGYGVYIVDCPRVRISNLTITGGIRDESGDACDAAVVVRRSFAEIDHCQLRDNTHYIEENIVGVGGVFVRDGGFAHIHHNAIVNNTWDGIALYRGASAVIHDNFIYGGRGAGIGITWDATAQLYRNIIAGYWKGIGSFGESMVSVENCIVTDCLGWGIIATGESRMDAVNNTVVRMGNVGFAGWSADAQMKLVNNISFGNGWRKQWVAPRVGVWMNCRAGNFRLLNNCVWGNEEGNYLEVPDPTGTFGNIGANPLFVTGKLDLPDDATPENTHFDSIPDDLFERIGGGYRLQIGSPCIGAGFEGYLNADATLSDLGAFGGWFGPMAPSAE
jgi:hypothetical protein